MVVKVELVCRLLLLLAPQPAAGMPVVSPSMARVSVESVLVEIRRAGRSFVYRLVPVEMTVMRPIATVIKRRVSAYLTAKINRSAFVSNRFECFPALVALAEDAFNFFESGVDCSKGFSAFGLIEVGVGNLGV